MNIYISIREMNIYNLIHHWFECQGECALGASEVWCLINTSELWLLLKKIEGYIYKAYHHLRQRNWIVRNGKQYGTDFIAYRHHPSQVHAEYVVTHS